jgi:hypothetical protein
MHGWSPHLVILLLLPLVTAVVVDDGVVWVVEGEEPVAVVVSVHYVPLTLAVEGFRGIYDVPF